MRGHGRFSQTWSHMFATITINNTHVFNSHSVPLVLDTVVCAALDPVVLAKIYNYVVDKLIIP